MSLCDFAEGHLLFFVHHGERVDLEACLFPWLRTVQPQKCLEVLFWKKTLVWFHRIALAKCWSTMSIFSFFH